MTDPRPETGSDGGDAQVSLEADWSAAAAVPTLAANTFLTLLGTPTRSGSPDAIHLIIGLLSPPVLTGSPKAVEASLRALDGRLPVDVHARLVLTRDRAAELVQVMQETIAKFDSVRGGSA